MPPAPDHGVTPSAASQPPAPEPSDPARDRGRPALLALLALAVVAHLVVLYLPGDDVPSVGFEVPGLDKLIHLGVFGVPAALVLLARLRPEWILALIAHAPVSEVLQGALASHRSVDPWDAVADLAGVGVGAAVALGLRRRGRGDDGPRPATGLDDPAAREYA